MSFTIQKVMITGVDEAGRVWEIENNMTGIALIPGDSFQLTWTFDGNNAAPRRYQATRVDAPSPKVESVAEPEPEPEQPVVVRRTRRRL